MPFVESEVARLRKVVVQRPGPAHAAMRPAHLDEGTEDYLLFDDLVHVPDAQVEHDQLVRVLQHVSLYARRYFCDRSFSFCLGRPCAGRPGDPGGGHGADGAWPSA